MLKVKSIMVRNVITADKNLTLEEAIDLLYKKHIGSLVIVDKNNKCLGIFTERDAIKCIAQKIPLTKPLKEHMTTRVLTINENASFDEARMMINEHRIRHLPVINDEQVLVGLFSLREVLDEFFGIEHQHSI